MFDYVDSLDAVARNRCIRGIVSWCMGVDKCPYSINGDAWVDDAIVWPPVIWPEMHEYLIKKKHKCKRSKQLT